MITEHDNQEGYCKMLGHFLTFSYCRSCNMNLPCSKVLDCWFQHFAIEEFINTHYSPEEQKAIFTPQKPKMQSLADILEQAQQRLKKKGDSKE